MASPTDPTATATARRPVAVAFDVVETPDAAPALERLAAQHVPIAALTNGSAKITQHLLAASGLDRFVTTLVSIDEITTWKPAPAPYLHAAARLGVQPAELAMVAVHAWDTHGARRAGLTTGWASRREGARSPVFDPPDVVGRDLVEVVEGLLNLPP